MKKKLFLTLLILLPLFGAVTTSQQQEEKTVLVCTGSHATKYHAYKCKGLKNCKGDIVKMKISDAKGKGYSACKICYK